MSVIEKKASFRVTKEGLKTFAILNIATIIVAIGIYFFKYPNNFSTGGISGITVLLGHYLPDLALSSINWSINIFLLIVGLLFLGKEFGLSTAYVVILLSALLDLFERFFPMAQPLTDQPFMELIVGVFLPSLGSALLFNVNASTGGTDIIAMIMKKFSNINTGSALLLADAAIAFASFIAFGPTTGLFSVFGLAIRSIVVNNVMEGMNLCKSFTIITEHAEPILDFIKIDLHRGATVHMATGMYNHTDKTVIMTAVSRAQGIRLQKVIREADPHAFVMITNTSEIIGKGFRGGI